MDLVMLPLEPAMTAINNQPFIFAELQKLWQRIHISRIFFIAEKLLAKVFNHKLKDWEAKLGAQAGNQWYHIQDTWGEILESFFHEINHIVVAKVCAMISPNFQVHLLTPILKIKKPLSLSDRRY